MFMSASVCVSCLSADYVKGFGGKFGVQTDRQDKSALGWDHQEKLQLHESQKGTGSHFQFLTVRRHAMCLSRTAKGNINRYNRASYCQSAVSAYGMSIPK